MLDAREGTDLKLHRRLIMSRITLIESREHQLELWQAHLFCIPWSQLSESEHTTLPEALQKAMTATAIAPT